MSPSFPATLESHPSSPCFLMQHGILKQAVYVERSAGGGHRAQIVAEDEEGPQKQQTLSHRFFFILIVPKCKHIVHVNTSASHKAHVQIPTKHSLPPKGYHPPFPNQPEFKCQNSFGCGKLHFDGLRTKKSEQTMSLECKSPCKTSQGPLI